MSQDIQDMINIVNQLTNRLDQLEQSKVLKKSSSRHGHSIKPYHGLSGFYFELSANTDKNTYSDIKTQLDRCLSDSNYLRSITKFDLGRAILNHYYKTGNMIFWVANQSTLLFGPSRRGMKEARQQELFQIPMQYLNKLTDHTSQQDNLYQVRVHVQFEEFILNEKKEIAINKLQQQLNSNPTTQTIIKKNNL